MKNISSLAFHRSSAVLRASLFGVLFLTSAVAGDWQIGVIDPGIGGEYSSLRLDKYGNAHVAYVDSVNANLKYAFWDHSLDKWFITTVDRSQGFCSLVLDSHQYPHISYLDYGTGGIKYAYWNGTTWQKQRIQIVAKEILFYTSIALAPGNLPHITYYEYFGPDGDQELHLRDVSWDGGQWEVRTVDATPGSGKFNSIAADNSGTLHVAYGNVKYENASLRYATWNGRSWDVEILEGAGQPGTSMWSSTLLMDKLDRPHIAYTDVRNREVKYATKPGEAWSTEVVDSLVKEGYPDRNGIALDEAGNPYISYYDAGAGLLKMAHRVDGHWLVEVVDRNYAGFTNSLQIHGHTVWITYADERTKDLKFARRSIDVSPPLQQSTQVIPERLPRSEKSDAGSVSEERRSLSQ